MDANKGPTVLIEYIFEYVNASFDRYHVSVRSIELEGYLLAILWLY